MEVDYPRVTHPFAGLLTLAGFLPRLACVRHAASVRSEPGSNSPINLAGDTQRVSQDTWSVSSCADVTTNSLKALRFPQSSSWTCYPVFKDRTSLPTADDRLRTAFYNPVETTQLPGACRCAVSLSPSLKGGAVYLPGVALSSGGCCRP